MFKGLSKKDIMHSFLSAGCMAVIGYAFSVMLLILLK